MTPRVFIEPERTIEFQQGYKEGFEAGKRALKRELQTIIDSLPDKEAYMYMTSAATFAL